MLNGRAQVHDRLAWLAAEVEEPALYCTSILRPQLSCLHLTRQRVGKLGGCRARRAVIAGHDGEGGGVLSSPAFHLFTLEGYTFHMYYICLDPRRFPRPSTSRLKRVRTSECSPLGGMSCTALLCAELCRIGGMPLRRIFLITSLYT